jgi:hypothetical protein
MTETYYHGTRRAYLAYAGICLTTSERSAKTYGAVHELTIDLDGLTVREVSGYDRETNTASADSAADLAALVADGVDVLVYDDEDEMGRQHDCIRIISQRAIDRLTLI